MSPRRLLHVANGTSTTRTIAAAGIPGQRSIWADPLYEGPVPAGLNDEVLLDVRRQFLGSRPQRDSGGARAEAAADPVNDLRAWRNAMTEGAFDELILWFEHDLFDQLNLIQLLTWMAEHLPKNRAVSLICIGSFPGRPDFKGLGQLTPDELRSLLDRRGPVGDDQYALARDAWEAFRAPTPERLEAVAREQHRALPYLAPALHRFLQEYPWTRDGLSRTERRLLELASRRTRLSTVFPRMADGETVYYVTDSSLTTLVETLADSDRPLLTVDRAEAATGSFHDTVALTDLGRSVLAGEIDRVTACRLDRWLGGVHLAPGSRLWRWDDARGRLRSD